jgi:Tol biopolymer transport system component
MSEVRSLLEEALGHTRPGADGLERARKRIRRRQRNRRLLAGGVALILTAAGIGFVAFAFRGSATVPLSTETPKPIAPAASNGAIWARVGGGDGPSFLYRVNPETGQTTALFNDGESTRSPLPGTENSNAIGSQYAWSPDGSQVAFADYSGYGAEIFLLSPDGSSRIQLTNDGGLDGFPSWSPDGTMIAYASDTAPPSGPDSPYYTPGCDYDLNGCPSDIRVINADGSGEARLTNDPTGATMPSWSPDGSKIAFVSGRADPNGDIFVMNSDGSGVTRLTSGPGYEFLPHWSPDGSRIAFESSRGDSTEVYIMNADGGGLKRLTDTGNTTRFAWSPDGTQIAFVGGGNSSRLYVMNADGSNVRSVASNPSYGFGEIAWRPVPLPSSSPSISKASGSDVTPSEPMPSPSASPVPSQYLPVWFQSASDSWHTWDTGPVRDGNATVAWDSTVPIDDRDRGAGYAIPSHTIAGLSAGDIVVTAEATPWGYNPDKGPYPPGSLDHLDLSQANVRGANSEEPPGSYAVYQIDGSYTLVRVYFGSSSPTDSEIQQAQTELDSLQVPPVCPVPSKGGLGAAASTTEGAPGDTVTLTGPMPFQRFDGSYMTDGRTGMVAWWNAGPKTWEHIGLSMTSNASPAGAGPVVRVGEGGIGACSFSIRFTVPDVPPGEYPISVLQEGPMPNPQFAALEASLVFRVIAP